GRGDGRQRAARRRPVEGGAAGAQHELDAADLVEVAGALAGAVAVALLAAQPLHEVLDLGQVEGVEYGDVGVAAEVAEAVQGGLVAVAGAQGELLDAGHGVEVAVGHLLGRGPCVRQRRGPLADECLGDLVGGGAGDGEVAVDLAPLGGTVLAVVQAVGVAPLVDGDGATPLNLGVAGVAGGGAAGVAGGLLLAWHGVRPCGGVAVRVFTKVFTRAL